MRERRPLKRRTIAGWASAVALLGLIAGCSPLSRLKCRFDLPTGAAPANAALLHVRAAAACPHYGGEPPPAPPEPPAPGLEDREPSELSLDAGPDVDAQPRAVDANGRPKLVDWPSVQRDGFEAEVSVRSSRCWVAVTAWYDVNGNGFVDDADYVAKLPATEIADRGLCLGNLTTASPMTLSRRSAP